MSPKAKTDDEASEARLRERAMKHIQDALSNLQFGVVSIIVQDGIVIQIERTEKVRLRGK